MGPSLGSGRSGRFELGVLCDERRVLAFEIGDARLRRPEVISICVPHRALE